MTDDATGHPHKRAALFEQVILLAILLAYGALAILYATLTPPWQVPDEPAHYNYVRQVAAGGCCPVLEAADWDAAYLDTLRDSGFDPMVLADLPAVQYEDHQPPLFYLLAAPVYSLTGGALTALRLFSALLGAGVILAVYGIGRAAGGPMVGLSAAAFAAFLPQHIAIMAGAGNDSLAELIVGLGLLGTLWLLTPEVPRRLQPGPVLLGLVMGLGFLTKATTLLLGPLVMLALLLRWYQTDERSWQSLLRAWALFLLPALLLGGMWWLRNIGLYGWPDFLGLGNHDAVVVGQPRTADWIAREGLGNWLALGIRVTFQSFWGQFGWMGVPMPDWVYAVLLAFTGVSYAGLIPLARRARRAPMAAARRAIIGVLAALFLLGIAQFVYYNTSFVQFQGRYLYPALAAYAITMAAGWSGWVTLAAARLPSTWADRLRWLPVIVMGSLAGLSAYALWRFILPNLPAW